MQEGEEGQAGVPVPLSLLHSLSPPSPPGSPGQDGEGRRDRSPVAAQEGKGWNITETSY